jgi:carbamoyltransferase
MRDSQQGSFLGPAYADDQIEAYLRETGASYRKLDRDELLETAADLIAGGHVVGWFQGRMEFGPRALGARSIIGDARSPAMQSVMNQKIKFRESFRPFAPSVLREQVSEYFELDRDSPYMLLVAAVSDRQRLPVADAERALTGIARLNVARSTVPAITHVDYSARIQTVSREDHQLYYDMIDRFYRKTGCPVIVNTSFNVRGEPIVESPRDAHRCFMRTAMDYLVMGSFLLAKSDQPQAPLDTSWQKEFALD